ncbi:MAG: threonylcarbamoyl-AMP synthase [Sphingobacteriales bacterium]|nr:threonylcarbamoyl-AMP synthase [Sphingobacteriales bacterium]
MLVDFEQDIEPCLSVLRNGGLILYPTDTIWGIGCDATNEKAVERVYRLKQREEQRSMIILLADERSLLQYVAAPDPAVFDYLEQLEKPTTLVFEGALGLPANLVNEDGSIGIRVVRDDFCRHLIRRLGRPLLSTSANISGSPAPANFTEISPAILAGVDYTVTYRRNDLTPRQPSAVVKWNRNGTQTILRP